MQLADSLRKRNPWEDGGLFFCSVREGALRFLGERSAGRALLVTDESAVGAFREVTGPRCVSAVLDTSDALPLFSMPDEVALVLATGKGNTLSAARFFAGVRRVPVMTFPSSPALDGAYEREAALRLGGVTARVALADGDTVCDLSLMQPRLAEGYERLLLARLARLEARVLRCFGCASGSEEAEERAYAALSGLAEELSAREIVEKNATVQTCLRQGASCGEGGVLAERLGRDGSWRAFLQLSALYFAFFGKGKPQPFVPDYRERARAAGAAYCEQDIPTPTEYASRVCALARKRAVFFGDAESIVKNTGAYRKNLYSLAGRAYGGAGNLDELKRLPERTRGLSCIIRDFGLMDW